MKRKIELPEKFKNIPLDSGDRVLRAEMIKVNEFDALYEELHSGMMGMYFMSLSFVSKEVEHLSDEDFRKMVTAQAGTEKMEISLSSSGYHIVSYGWYSLDDFD